MKKLFFPGFLLLFFGFTSSQVPLAEVADSNAYSTITSLIKHHSEEEVSILNDYLAVSAGFYNSEFVDTIEITAGEIPTNISLNSQYMKPLQYTVSDVEGIILDRGRFIGQVDLNFSRRPEGDYAVYIFAANRVVRAFIVSKNTETVQVF